MPCDGYILSPLLVAPNTAARAAITLEKQPIFAFIHSNYNIQIEWLDIVASKLWNGAKSTVTPMYFIDTQIYVNKD